MSAIIKQNQPSINRHFIDSYKTFKKVSTYRFAQPVLAYLVQKQKNKINTLQRIYKNKLTVKIIMHFIFGNYLHYLNKSKKATSLKGTPGKSFDLNKTSKIVYAVNQFTLNTLVRY